MKQIFISNFHCINLNLNYPLYSSDPCLSYSYCIYAAERTPEMYAKLILPLQDMHHLPLVGMQIMCLSSNARLYPEIKMCYHLACASIMQQLPLQGMQIRCPCELCNPLPLGGMQILFP